MTDLCTATVSYSTHSRVLNDATTPLGLRPKLDGDKPVVGSWLMYPGANLARQVASQGFDVSQRFSLHEGARRGCGAAVLPFDSMGEAVKSGDNFFDSRGQEDVVVSLC